MHAKTRHRARSSAATRFFVGVALVVLAIPIQSIAQGEGQRDPEAPPPIPSGGNPEYKIKTLPNDTFKPSEKISEDFPVPFPVDI